MKFVLIAVLSMGSSLTFAECSRPEAPDLPDGEVAEMAAMVEGQKAVKVYVAASEVFLDCLTAEGEAAAEEEPAEAKTARIEAHNAVVDDMEAVAGEFNEEIREYKAKTR